MHTQFPIDTHQLQEKSQKDDILHQQPLVLKYLHKDDEVTGVLPQLIVLYNKDPAAYLESETDTEQGRLQNTKSKKNADCACIYGRTITCSLLIRQCIMRYCIDTRVVLGFNNIVAHICNETMQRSTKHQILYKLIFFKSTYVKSGSRNCILGFTYM